MKKRVILGISLIVITVFVYKYLERRNIKNEVYIISHLLQEEQIKELYDYISDNYSDSFGYTKDDLIRSIDVFLSEYDIKIRIEKIKISIKTRPAVVYVRGKVDYLGRDFNIVAVVEDINLVLKKEKDLWKIISILSDKHLR
ncbi:MAG: hypothetical protein AB1765_00525 [Candidatus Hydrogenedentota bacterium]